MYKFPLVAEQQPDILQGDLSPKGKVDMQLLGEHHQLDFVVNHGLEMMGDLGISADVFQLREIPKRRRALERQKETLRCLEKVVQAEWQAYYQDRKEIDDDEKAIGQRLIEARALTRLEAHLHYYGEHAHLDNPAHRNDIIRRSWNNIRGDRLYEDSECPPRLSRPPTRQPTPSGLPTIEEMGLAFSGITPAQIQTKR